VQHAPARPTPRPATTAGEGTIVVRAVPWAYVTIDGADAGETPLQVTSPARRHHVRAHHPTLGDDEVVVDLSPGQRFLWKPRLSR
jgi:hypothetical protein